MPSTAFDTAYQNLNPEQRLAVDTIEGAVLVIAGPGSGKTQLLSMRVANILRQTDTPASSILCLTFTESAAQNMRQRLNSLIGREAYKVAIHTFHSFGTEIISHNPEHFFFGAGYSPADNLAQIKILRDIFEQLPRENPLSSNHEDHGFTFLRDALECISALKKGGVRVAEYLAVLDMNKIYLEQFNVLVNQFLDDRINAQILAKLPDLIAQLEQLPSTVPVTLQGLFPSLAADVLRDLSQVQAAINQIQDPKKQTAPLTEWKNRVIRVNAHKQKVHRDTLNWERQQALATVYEQYQREIHRSGLFDFDDMLLEVAQAMEIIPELRYNYQERFLYVLVDEFQDTNGVQMRLLDSLFDSDTVDGMANILAVGDDDQAVFKFQGASLENMLGFQAKYPAAKIIPLTKNYRSTQPILDLAMEVIELSGQRLSDLTGVDKRLQSMVGEG